MVDCIGLDIQPFCRCRGESKRRKMRRVKSLTFRGLAMLSVVFVGLPNAATAREIRGQVVVTTKDGKSIGLASVEFSTDNRSEVKEAIKQVDETLKARRAKVRSGDIDYLVRKVSDAFPSTVYLRNWARSS